MHQAKRFIAAARQRTALFHAWLPGQATSQPSKQSTPADERPHLQQAAQVLQIPLNLLLAQGQVVLAILALGLQGNRTPEGGASGELRLRAGSSMARRGVPSSVRLN